MTFVKRISAKLVDYVSKNICFKKISFLGISYFSHLKIHTSENITLSDQKKNFPPINTFYDHSETLYTVRTKLQPKKKQLYSNSVHVLTITDNSSALKEGLLKFFPYSFLKFTYCFVGFFKRT